MTVEYRDIKDFPGYRVGNDGSIWSCWRRTSDGDGGGSFCILGNEWKLLKQDKQKKCGHARVRLYANGKSASKLVHRLVLEAFVGPCPPGMQACHFPDRDTANNRLCNLRWDTPRANNEDRIKHGTMPRGEKVYGAKLTETDVKTIRIMHSLGVTQTDLAKTFNVSQGSISSVVIGKSWAHVS